MIKDIPVYFPQSMKSLPNWVLWKLETDANGRKTKIPYSALYDGKASSTNPDTWTTFENAKSKLETGGYSGLGFVFSLNTRLVFVDVDHCVDDDGKLNQIATDIIQTIGKDTYYELSQSGTGLHIFAFGEIPKATKHNSVEMYSEKRFVAMTGRAISPHEPTDKTSELLAVYSKYKTPERVNRPRIQTDFKLSFSDNEIINKASNSKSGETFRKLMSGDISDFESHSNADFKFCQILAFWSDRDFETIERIFSSSGLCRDKWLERTDYRERTITTACNSISESISEFIARKKQEETCSYEKCILHYGGHFRGCQ